MSGVAVVAEAVIVLLPAVICHEVAHGAVAYALGDPTAARRGRLTLNPLPHIDPVGTILLPGLLLLAPLVLGGRPHVFGWAKPVPVDYRNLRNPRRDAVLVALAGPLTNLVLAGVSTLALAVLLRAGVQTVWAAAVADVLGASLLINCVLAAFNLLPVPPLDGGRVLTVLLPARAASALAALERVGVVVVLLLVLNTNLLGHVVHPLLAFFSACLRVLVP